MSPVMREYLIYAIAVIFGFCVYLAIDHFIKVDFMFSMFAGFAAIHLAIVMGRKYMP